MTTLDPELLEAALAELSARRLPKHDNVPKLIALILAVAVSYAAFEARIRVVEDRYEQLRAVITEFKGEMKDELRALRAQQATVPR